MAQVYGEIESLKRLKGELRKNDLDSISSIGDINRFFTNYEIEKNELFLESEQVYEKELLKLSNKKNWSEIYYQKKKDRLRSVCEKKIGLVEVAIEGKRARTIENRFFRFLNWVQTHLLVIYRKILINITDYNVYVRSYSKKRKMDRAKRELEEFTQKKESFVRAYGADRLTELERKHSVLDQLYPQIAGTIGEMKVSKDLSKLSNDHILINDFTYHFKPPIYYREEDDLIQSIQIDHLLLSPAGVFVIETKNWSKKTVNNPLLRKPIDQVKRSGYALYLLLNSKKRGIALGSHVLGNKKIPVKNLVVMINEKPNIDFVFAKVLSLKELIPYLENQRTVLSRFEIKRIANHLNRLNES